VPDPFDYQIHLLPGAKSCFLEVEFLSCSTSINYNILVGLIEACKLIKELDLFINAYNNNHGIIRLVEAQKKLFNIYLSYRPYMSHNKTLENSLIKHANTVQYLKINKEPFTKILSYLLI